MSTLHLANPALRELITAALLDLRETGALTDVDGVARTTDAVLAEVQAWLRERAQAHTIQLASAALRIAARELDLPGEGRD